MASASASASASSLPDELWRHILEIAVKTPNLLSCKDLCCVSISCRRLHRLSGEDSLWSHLLSSDFPLSSSSSPLSSSSFSNNLNKKSLYRLRFERDRDKKNAAHRRVVLRKESQIAEHSRKIREIETSLQLESEKLKLTANELSNVHKVRQASVALNVWQPEVVRGKQKQMVEQCAVPVESRVHALEMELKLCNRQIVNLRKSYDNEKQRLDAAKEELESIKYHPLRDYESRNNGISESSSRRKKLKRCSRSEDSREQTKNSLAG